LQDAEGPPSEDGHRQGPQRATIASNRRIRFIINVETKLPFGLAALRRCWGYGEHTLKAC
jgi:hypothetical protein